jgi:hypothetical protein
MHALFFDLDFIEKKKLLQPEASIRDGGKTVHVVFNYLSRSHCAGILEQYIGTRNRIGIGLSYRPVRLHRMAESTESIPRNQILGSINVYKYELYAGILEQSMGARNRVGIGLSYLHARLHRLVELIPWNRFLVKKFGLWCTKGGRNNASPYNHHPFSQLSFHLKTT